MDSSAPGRRARSPRSTRPTRRAHRAREKPRRGRAASRRGSGRHGCPVAGSSPSSPDSRRPPARRALRGSCPRPTTSDGVSIAARRSSSSAMRRSSTAPTPRPPETGARPHRRAPDAPAVAVRGRQAAGERFEQCIRARVVAARSDVRVLRPQQVGERARFERPDDADPLETAVGGRPANVSSNRSGSRFRSSHTSVSAPLRGLSDQLARDHPEPAYPPDGSRLVGGMEDRRVDRVRDDDRLAQLEAELTVLCERELRLEDRRGRQRGVDLGDPRVRAVVESPVGADRPVDAVHHPRPAAREAPKPPEVEVERVEEAHGRASGDRPDLDLEPRPSSSRTSARRN